jgi:alpha-tubulin suppressor-like RCC1 family protein
MKTFGALLVSAAVSISCHAVIAATPPGQVIGWGFNYLGQAASSDPNLDWTGAVAVAGHIVTNAVAIAAGMEHAVILRNGGTVGGSGFNNYGQSAGISSQNSDTTNGTVSIGGNILNHVVGIAAGDYFSLALKDDGTVVSWGGNDQGERNLPHGLTNIIAIAAGAYHSLALKGDGTVVSWGSKNDVPDGLTNIIAVAAGSPWYAHDLALRGDGMVVEWVSSQSPETLPVGLSNVVAIAAGGNHSLALRADTTVFGWGANEGGQATGIPSNDSEHRASGTVIIGGQVLTNVTAISAGNEYSLALEKDGTVVAWGNHRFYRNVPADLTNVVAIAAGDGFCLVIKKP